MMTGIEIGPRVGYSQISDPLCNLFEFARGQLPDANQFMCMRSKTVFGGASTSRARDFAGGTAFRVWPHPVTCN